MSYDYLSSVSQNVLKFYQQGKNPIFRHIKFNNSGTAKEKIVKKERDPPLFTSKQLIKFKKILRNTTGIKPNERRRMPVEKCWPDWPENVHWPDGPLSIHFNWPVHNFTGHRPAPKGIPVLYPRNDVVGGYTGFTMSC
jgi:hypothetical protein